MSMRFAGLLLLPIIFLGVHPASHAKEFLENSQGVMFKEVPGYKVMMAVWETRVKDYEPFVKEMKRPWPKPDYPQSGDHPAVNVSWEDAKAFAQWLTQKERQAGTLPDGWRYRLPRSEEWSAAVGLPTGEDAKLNEMALITQFPWNADWPPTEGCGNYHPSLGVDSFDYTSPAGSFSANSLGFYDLGGNVWEWCEDVYNQSPDYRVLRGASWRMRNPGDLLSSTAIGNRPSLRLAVYGFRLVVEPSSEPSS